MPTSPLLSVVVPMHNSAPYIRRCLNGLLNQAVKSIQIVVVDDCSEDESVSIVEAIAKENPSIELYRMAANRGPGAARNTGKERAKGDFITFLDSDDWVDLTAYAETIEHMISDDSDVGIFGIKTEYEHPSDSALRYSYRRHNVVSGEYALQLFARLQSTGMEISPLLGNKIFRRTDLLMELKFPETGYFEDAVFVFLCLVKTRRVSFIPGEYLHYFQHSESITHSLNKNYIDIFIQTFCFLKSELISHNLFESNKECYLGVLKHCISSFFLQIKCGVTGEEQQRQYLYDFFAELCTLVPASETIRLVSVNNIFMLFPYQKSL